MEKERERAKFPRIERLLFFEKEGFERLLMKAMVVE